MMDRLTPKLGATLALACILATVAACAPPMTGASPVSVGPNSNQEPQPANSLPPGFRTVNPIAPSTGILGSTGTRR